jgi:hypothetical protein
MRTVLMLLLVGAGVAHGHERTCEHECVTNDDCTRVEFCDKERGACDAPGVCRPRGINLYCVQRQEPVCGCDGNTYENECVAYKAGQSIDYDAACGG